MANDKMEQYEKDIVTLEKSLDKQLEGWNAVVSEYANGLKGDIMKLHLVDADVTNSRQLVSSEIRKYALIISKTKKFRKPLYKKQFEYYSTSYQIVLKSGSDKMKLIESDIKMIDYKMDMLDNHISYLRDTNDNLKQMGYSIKNRIELLNILGLD